MHKSKGNQASGRKGEMGKGDLSKIASAGVGGREAEDEWFKIYIWQPG